MARAPGDAAKSTLVPDVADAAGVPLDRVTGLYGMVDRLAQTVGPLLGGALVAWLGPLTALVADAASFGVSAGLIAATTPRGRAGRARHGVAPALAAGPEPGAEVGTRVDVGAGGGADAGTRARDAAGERYLDQLRAGFAFLRGDKLLRAIVLMVATTNLLDTATMTVLIPVWATGHGGPASIGLLGSAVGATAILGSMVAAAAGHRLPRRPTYFLAFIVCGPPSIAVLGLDLPVWAVATVYAVAGLGFGIINPILSASMYERVPRPLLGRVLALVGTLAWAGIPLGGPLGGALVALLGLGKAALATAGSYLLTTLLPALRPEWRELDSRRGHRPPATSAETAEPATRP
jgi:Major Facilitator Superfamily